MNSSFTKFYRQRGLSYVEVLIAAAIIAISAVPVSTALRQSLAEADHSSKSTVIHFQLLAKMEEVLSFSYAELSQAASDASTPSSFSDASGTADRRLVFIAQYDGDNADLDDNGFTGADSDLLWIKVEIENTAQGLQALRSRQ